MLFLVAPAGAAGMNWTTKTPTKTGRYWYRKDPAGASILFCGTVWDHVADFAGLNEPVTFMKDHLLEGEWAFPVEPPFAESESCSRSARPLTNGNQVSK